MCGIWAIFGIPEYSKYTSYAGNIAGRGPDCFRMETLPHFQNCCLAFHWLEIVQDSFGMQPMRVRKFPHLYMMYNGEIYNHKELGEKYKFKYFGQSDGEVILHLHDKFGVRKAAQLLDGVFAFCIIDTEKKEIHLGRDTFGVRPMFTLSVTGKKAGVLAICSEAKGLVPIREHLKQDRESVEVKPFLPGYYASYSLAVDGQATLLKCEPYTHVGKPPEFDTRVLPKSSDVMQNIRDILTEAVRKRLMTDRRIGCFLSGGLDSSLVAALLCKLAKEQGINYPIQTFSIGMEGSTDLKAARKVASHIGSEHHEVAFTAEEGIQALRKTIYTSECYDPMTIRGCVPHYLIAKYVSEETNTVVLYSGEASDELTQGYIYFHKAPTPEEADKESRKILEDLYLFDVLRGDRCTSVHGLEIRIPFLDVQFTSYILSLPAQMRQPKDGCEKWLLRASFDSTDLLPKEILWRPKEGFIVGLSQNLPGQSWFEILQRYLESQVSDEGMAQAVDLYPFNTPKTKEALYYRRVYEEFFPGCSNLTPYFWMPKWVNVNDPSPRVLPNYK